MNSCSVFEALKITKELSFLLNGIMTRNSRYF